MNNNTERSTLATFTGELDRHPPTMMVSVIIPTYNSSKFLPEAIESALNQTYPNVEIVVVDDGSNDDTQAVCDRYPTVKYIYQQNQGVSVARNTGINVSKGEYLLFLDSDDCIFPQAVAIGVEYINAHPEVGFVFGRYEYKSINPDGSYTIENTYDNQPEISNYTTLLAGEHEIQCGCVLFRRESLAAVNGFDPSIKYMQDQNLFLRVAYRFPIYFHNQIVSEYRVTGSNVSAQPARMLIAALRTHRLQWDDIQASGNQEYAAAYQRGQQYWLKLFVERLPYEIMRCTQSEQWIEALGHLGLLLNCDPKLQYLDREIYAVAYKTLLAKLRTLPITASLAYWKQQLAGAAPLLSLPTDRPRPAVQTGEGATQSFVISPEITQGLCGLSQDRGVTLFMTLLAAYQTLLYRYTGIEDIVVGAPISTYLNSHLFVNGVVLRTDMSEHPSFEQLLERVKKVTLLGQAYQDLPYILLVDELCPQPDPSYQPLVQVTFLFEENVDLQQLNLSTLSASPWVLENNAGRYDLTLFLKETEAGLQGKWVYNTDLFDDDTIERLNSHFQTLLVGIIANPQQSISELPLLTATETDQLLREWNQTEVEYPQDRCIHQLFEEQVLQSPNAIAVVFGGEHLTYAELNIRANQLAHYLRSLGVGNDTLVGICLERSLEMAVVFLGIFKAGGAYLPLDPSYPSDRLAFMLEDSQALIILTQERLLGVLPDCSAQIVCLEPNWPEISQQSRDNPVVDLTADSLAYVMYTSGSTGNPKGVMIIHRGLINHNTAIAKLFDLNPSDRILQSASISFDIAVEEIFPTWITGGSLILRNEEVLASTRNLLQFVEKEQLTILNLPTALWHEIVNGMREFGEKLPNCVRLVVVGGEKASKVAYLHWWDLVGDRCRWINTYGPTETTVSATFYEPATHPATQQSIAEIPIGRPLDNTQIYILVGGASQRRQTLREQNENRQLQPVPIGVPGELYIGGAGVAKGYLNRPELTASKFIPNPFSQDPSAYIYKTGDLVRYLRDGNIEFIGRVDDQVKIRGFRVELGEIEELLAQHSQIRETAVIVREDVAGDKRLFAYIVPTHGQTFTVDDLRDLLSQSLPTYMIPTGWAILDALPMTPNGKIDRRALLAYNPIDSVVSTENTTSIANRQPNSINFLTANPVDTSAIAPTTPTEELLVGIWAKVLGLETVSIHDNFFALGGHSLLAAKMIGYCYQTFDRELSLRELFGSPTVAELAQIIDRHQQPATKLANYQIIPRRANPDRAKLSFVQQRLWFLHQLQPDGTEYQFKLAIRLNGVLNLAALQQSLDTIVARHETLRTNFINEDGNPIQVIQAPQSLELRLIDLQDCPPTERDSQLTQRLKQEYQRPFNLAEDLILRACLFKLAPAEHVLLLVTHHIVFDGWSISILWQELSSLYSTCCQGLPPSLPALPIQYADFAEWQHQQLGDRELDHQLQYWKQQLAGANPLLELPTDYSRPPIQTYAGASGSFVINQDLVGSLTALGIQHGATLFMVLLAAFQTLLYRHSGQEDIIVGTPFAGRNRAETDPLIGFFVNTLVMRTDCSGNPSFQELVGRVRQIALSAHDNQDLPFDRLVQELQPERSLSYNPLCQVMFIFQNLSIIDLELLDLTVEALVVEIDTTNFDLSMELEEISAGLKCWFKYNPDLFEATTIERMMSHFQTLLEGIVANPQQSISELPLLTATETEQLLREWNQTQVEYPQDRCIHQLFEEQVLQNPNAIAVVFEGKHLTYAELNSRANQLAHYLRSLGVSNNTLVGICLERSLEMAVAFLGIFKAGGAYLPLDPSYPSDRLAFMLEDAQVLAILTQERLLGILPDCAANIICLEPNWSEISQQSRDNPVVDLTTDSLAYVIYTSGSTGKPKGVKIFHRGLTNHNTAMAKLFGLNPRDRVLQSASISFDVAVQEIFPTWITGGTLIFRNEEVLASTRNLLQFVETEQITILSLPTALWHEIVNGMREFDEKLPNCLRLVVVGGEKASKIAYLHWWNLVGDRCRWINAYGPTETTVCATFYEPAAHPATQHCLAEIPIGRPLDNTQIYILVGGASLHENRQLQPVPIGVPGELYIGGAGVAKGYLNRPELTASKFIPNPFSQDANAYIYKTGDLVRYLPDGNIEYLGRLDHQVKIRGFRIELGEIEALLSQHPSVHANVVIARADESGNKRLVAYIVSHTEPIPAPSELRQFLKEQLPNYMVPSAFVMLEALPLTPNGKIDHRALPALDKTTREAENTFVAPRTPTEEILSAIWADILGVEVGVYDNFFELGGHSLNATQAISRVRNALCVDLPLRLLFEFPTLGAFSAQLEATRNQNNNQSLPPIQPIARDREMPLSFAQQRLWFLDRLKGESAHYNIPMALRLSGVLNVTALEQAIAEIVRRHEALRTTFSNVNGSVVQVIASNIGVTLSAIDLQELPKVEQSAEVQRLANEDAQRPFNLSRGPLFCVTLLRLEPEENVLLVTMHHIVSDGWSMGILLEELSSLYEALSQGKTSPLPELPIQYADFASWQRQWLQGEMLETQLNYWKQQLSGSPPVLDLPLDRPRPAVQTFRGGSQSFQLNPDLTQRLKTLSQKSRTTLFMTLLAAFSTFLSRYTRQEDVIVGSPIANRNRSEIDSLIGFFVNTLVLRTDVSGNPSFSDLLGRVRQVALDAYAYQDVPFDQVVAALQPERNLSYNPLFQVMFVLQNAPMEKLQLPGLTLTPLAIEPNAAKFDLTLIMDETEQGLSGNWEYNTDLFDAATITRMMSHFQTLLEGIVAAPEQRLADLPILTATERHQLLVEWNDTQTDYPKDLGIHQLFEDQVERTPDRIALVFEQERITYRELNHRANQLAHYLQSLGVKPEVLVGICVERSIETIVGLLAILKAGGAYVPLDPSNPPERLSYILNDVGISILLTQKLLSERLPDSKIQKIYLDTDWENITCWQDDNLIDYRIGDGLAYIIYTSGSTGQPKGVCVQHRGVVRLVKNNNYANLNCSETFFQFAPLSFDASTFEIWGSLLNGARLVIPLPGKFSLEELIQMIQFHDITILWLTAALFNLMVEEQVNDLTSLRQLLVGGDILSVSHVRKFMEKNANCQLINGYGPTENTTFTCCYHIAEDEQLENSVLIGRPIANTQVYILDQHLQPVPIGVAGELCTGGDGLARGYFNRPELDREKFILNPFLVDKSTLLYKTGDLARYLPDGNIEFLGRINNQVKIRGFRIELGEIEAVLAQYPAVRETVAIATEDHLGDKRLVAYVIPHSDRVPTASELRSFLKAKLPDYMVPSAFVMLDAIPLTPNDKVDRRALPAPDWEQRDLAEIFVAPRTPVEEALANIWSQVLGVKQIGIKDNFFDLGGHSLLAIRLVAEIEKNLNLKIPLAALFELTTVAQMASLFQHNNSSAASSHQNLLLDSIVSKQLKNSCSDSASFGLDREDYQRLMVILAGRKGKRPRQNSLMVAIGEHGVHPPVFFCANSSAEVLPLAKHLGEKQPVYFLESGLTVIGNNQAKIKAIAAHHVEDILAVQPDSPYLLGGYCFGSLVVYEIAQQLSAKGKQVELLFFIDTYGNHSIYETYEKIVVFITHHRNNLARIGVGDRLRYIQQNIGRLISKRVVKITNGEEIAPSYKPQTYPGKVMLFCAIPNKYEPIPAAQFMPIVPDWITLFLFKRAGWDRQLIPNLEIHKVVGNHLSITQEPHIKMVAEKLRTCIDRDL